jgi:hypothetical protein
MLLISILNISTFLDLIMQFLDFIKLNLWIILLSEIIISILVIWIASRSTDKILKGLQGTASATVIARGAIDAYKAWEGNNSENEDNSEENKDKKDTTTNDNNKDKATNDNNKDKIIDNNNNNNETNEK